MSTPNTPAPTPARPPVPTKAEQPVPTLGDPAAAPAPGGRIGLPTASALYVAAVLGTGVLVLPGLAAAAAGPASLLAIVALLVLSIPLAGTFAALAARYPDAGGVATFVRLALGETAARASGYIFIFGAGFGAPVVADLGGEYLVAALGLDHAAVIPIAFAFLLVPLALAVFGLKVSGSVQLVLSALLVAVVIGVVASSMPAVHAANFTPFLAHGWGGVGVAVSLFVWAFAGWEALTHIAGEFRHPRRTIPLATAIAIAVVGVAYLALQFATVGVLGTSGPSSSVPLIDLVSVTLPGVGPIIVAVITAIVVVGVLNAYVPALANLTASLGRDRHLPALFGRGVEPGAVPRRALGLIAAVMLTYTVVFFAFGLDLRVFVLVQSASIAVVYILGMVAAVRLLKTGSIGWLMAIVSVVLCLGLLVLAGWYLVVPALLTLVAVAVPAIRRSRSRAR